MNKITTWKTEHPEVIFTFGDGTQDRYSVDDLAELRMQTYNLAESKRWDDLPEEPTKEHLALSLQLLEQQHKKYVHVIEEVYEIAFGDNAINKDYSGQEVIDRLKEFSDDSYKYKEGYKILMGYWDSLPDEEKPKIHKELEEIGL